MYVNPLGSTMVIRHPITMALSDAFLEGPELRAVVCDPNYCTNVAEVPRFENRIGMTLLLNMNIPYFPTSSQWSITLS